ncbi:MAG: EutN/CcmL family microcompartment protein [Acidobacteriota bacterium]
MILADVVGHVVATAKHAELRGAKLMLVQPVTPMGDQRGAERMAVDAVGAGVGERVLVVIEGRSAAQAMQKTTVPVDAAIVGIVDRIDLL